MTPIGQNRATRLIWRATSRATLFCMDNSLNDSGPAKDLDKLQQRAFAGAELIRKAIVRGPDTGQGRRLIRFLAGLYHGERFPFDLTDLRSLDGALQEACLSVLTSDRHAIMEIHHWPMFNRDDLNKWFMELGLYYEVQKRRIANDLYQDRFGDAGHPDMGLSDGSGWR